MAQLVRNLPTIQEEPASIPGSGKSLGEGNGNPIQYSGLKDPMDKGAQWAIDHGVANSWTRLRNLTQMNKETVVFLLRKNILFLYN